jgi:chromate transport protein ChrA
MVSYIDKMAVKQRMWLDEDMFRDGVALCQTTPFGATAMQVSVYVGFRARGVIDGHGGCMVAVFFECKWDHALF